MTSYRSAAVLPVSPHVSVTDMKSVVLIVSYFLLFQVNGFRYVNFTGSTDVPVDVDLTGVLHRVDRRFLSVTLGASLASKEKFMYLLRSDSRSCLPVLPDLLFPFHSIPLVSAR